jgi:hypothetical protein
VRLKLAMRFVQDAGFNHPVRETGRGDLSIMDSSRAQRRSYTGVAAGADAACDED